MTTQRSVDDVLRPMVLPNFQGVPYILYQKDNVRPHTGLISQHALQGVPMFCGPVYSPDLSPIEHIQNANERHLQILPQPRSEDEL